MEKNSEQLFDRIKKDLIAYLELRFDYLKLSTYERTGKVLGVLSYGLVILFTAFFAFLFIFLSLGFFLGELFDSEGLGFISVAVLYLILILALLMNKARIVSSVENEIISALMSNDEKTNDTENNEQQASNSSGEIKN
ncbi:hypothetical protein [Massilibacteroides sp.]|uniref:hypothetical protein n=1 Tax=Massilibacteroides sp. TaxID=2034766 RepID=UPI002635B55C|nr:hypothetical protein [Massilibacteroides sp.]MDD4516313.1 hypothetical protein [Massilibacteroides sp.]